MLGFCVCRRPALWPLCTRVEHARRLQLAWCANALLTHGRLPTALCLATRLVGAPCRIGSLPPRATVATCSAGFATLSSVQLAGWRGGACPLGDIVGPASVNVVVFMGGGQLSVTRPGGLAPKWSGEAMKAGVARESFVQVGKKEGVIAPVGVAPCLLILTTQLARVLRPDQHRVCLRWWEPVPDRGGQEAGVESARPF